VRRSRMSFPSESLSCHELAPTMKLKQGDPSIYGRRSSEEVFSSVRDGWSPSSFQASPPPWPGRRSVVSHAPRYSRERGCVHWCGEGWEGVQMPEYERGRTLVILMGVARLQRVVDALLGVSSLSGPAPASTSTSSITTTTTPYTPTRYPPYLPEAGGPQRPPGMIVVGWSGLGLWGDGAAGEEVLDEGEGDDEGARKERDERRVKGWLGGEGWRVREGLDEARAALDKGWLEHGVDL